MTSGKTLMVAVYSLWSRSRKNEKNTTRFNDGQSVGGKNKLIFARFREIHLQNIVDFGHFKGKYHVTQVSDYKKNKFIVISDLELVGNHQKLKNKKKVGHLLFFSLLKKLKKKIFFSKNNKN